MTELLAAGFTDTSSAISIPTSGTPTPGGASAPRRKGEERGLRIDYFICSDRLRARIADAKIYPEIMGSDHCPVGLELK